MAKKPALGRGLDALMPFSEEEYGKEISSKNGNFDDTANSVAKPLNVPSGITVDENGTLWVNPALLKPNPEQPRHEFAQDELQELSDSIKENGILQPPLIEDAGDGTFYIIAGERRTRAAKMAGLEKIPVQLGKFNDVKKLEVALIENIQRENLNPIEEAMAFKRLLEEFNLKQDEVAERVSKSRTTVTNALRLLKLCDEVQQMVVEDMISTGHARALLGIEDPEEQYSLAQLVFDEKLSVRETE